jgi:Ca2+-binding RTX toxin-like protein
VVVVASSLADIAAIDGRTLAHILNASNIRSAVVSFSDSDYGREAAAAFDAIYRGVHRRTITGVFEHDIGKSDYSADVAQLSAVGGDILVIFADFGTSARALIEQSILSGAYDDFALGRTAYSPLLTNIIPGDRTVTGIEPLDLPYGPHDLFRPYNITNGTITNGAFFAGNGVLASVIAGTASGNSLMGGATTDLLLGDAGNDTITGGRGGDFVYAGADDDTVFGGAGYDMVSGGTGNDNVSAGSGNDTLYGEHADDRLQGEMGRDRLFGGEGNDSLYGGHGNDTLDSGAGSDLLMGGSGVDTFVFRRGSGQDQIADFLRGRGDAIQLDHQLWQGNLTVQQVIAQFGSVSNGAVLLSFADGDSLQIDRFTDLTLLVTYIEII